MMHLTGDLRILRAMASELGVEVTNAPKPGSKTLLQGVLVADAEHGDVMRSIREALADGKVTPRELAEITRQINEAIESLQTLRKLAELAEKGSR